MTISNDKRLLKGEETYNRILDSALDLISENGINGISAAKIASLSGISKSTLFHHFKSVDAIPEAVLNEILDELLEPMNVDNYKTLEEYLISFGSGIITSKKNYNKIYKSFFSFYNESLFNEIYRSIIKNYLEKSKMKLNAEIRTYLSGDITDLEIDNLSSLIISSLDGIGIHLLIRDDSDEYYRIWNLQVQCILSFINK